MEKLNEAPSIDPLLTSDPSNLQRSRLHSRRVCDANNPHVSLTTSEESRYP